MTANLLSRLQGLTAPDREVDARIHYALFPETEVLLDPGDMRTKRPGRYGPLSEMPMDCWTDYDAICHHIGAQPYTASLDAAVALCERGLPGWGYMAGKIHDRGEASLNWMPAQGFWQYNTEAATPAIALLIAILTALEARDA